MLAYYHLCENEMAEAEEYFVNRTLKLAEKTSLKVTDVAMVPRHWKKYRNCKLKVVFNQTTK